MQTTIDDVTLSFVAERYLSDDGYSLYDGDTSPALVDFTRLSLGIGYRF